MNTIETGMFLAAIGCTLAALIIRVASARLRHNATSAIARCNRVAPVLAWCLLTISIGARAAQTGHGPFTSMYEFTAAFAWGVLGVLLLFQRRYPSRGVSIGALFVVLALLAAAYTMPSRPVPLVPALQNSLLLSLHVAAAIVAYGAFAVAFIAALLILSKASARGDEHDEDAFRLEDVSYHAAAIGFPAMTLVIVLGAMWADVAWGRYWGWDPKETASLVTWLIYAGYLHARVLRGWHGRRAASLLVIGFVAVLLTFFGNYVFQSLHAYL